MFKKRKEMKRKIRDYEKYIHLVEQKFNIWPQAKWFVTHCRGAYCPDYNHPKTLHEKATWIAEKYYQKSPLVYFSGNKVTSKIYFESKLGSDEYIVKTYGVYNTPEEINWDILPNSFVIKTTMGYQAKNVILVKDKCKFKHKKHKNTLNAMTRSLHNGRPCPIIIEQLLENFPETETLQVTDYKFFCLNGKPTFVRVHSIDKDSKTFGSYDKNMTYYSLPDYEKLDLIHASVVRHKNPDIPKPECLNEMIKIAEKLSKDLPFARVDLYLADGKVYVGEITILGATGYVFDPVSYDHMWGDMISLPTEDEIKTLIEQDKAYIKQLVNKHRKMLEQLSNFEQITELL